MNYVFLVDIFDGFDKSLNTIAKLNYILKSKKIVENRK